MTITVFSIQTTGLPSFRAPLLDERQPAIIGIAATLYSAKWVEQGSFHGITRAGTGFSSADAAAVHGISERERELYGTDIKLLMAYFMRFARMSKAVATFNMEFAAFMIEIELARLGADPTDFTRGGLDRVSILTEAAKRYNDGRPMKIAAAHEAATGIAYDQPERAKHVYDAKAAARVLKEIRA